MTNRTKWTEYTGSDEQIAELRGAKNGYVIRYSNDKISNIAWNDCIKNSQFVDWKNGERHCPTHYWLIPDDPLREMKIRQAQTGQPVWVRYNKDLMVLRPGDKAWRKEIIVTTTPDWNIPNAEYSFTPFEKEIEFKEE